MHTSQQLGRWGEDLALSYLEQCEFQCLDRRFRRQGGELDLVVQKQGLIVFVEVKSRGRGSPAPPEAWVTPRKIARMRQTARHWLAENTSQGPCHYRFDVVAVEFNGEGRGLRLRHFEGIA